MLNLLTQNNQDKLTLLDFLENNIDTIIPLWQLEELLNLSTFKTSNTIEELSDELSRFSSGTIKLLPNKNVTAYGITNELINKFKLYYLKLSPLFKIYMFFYNGDHNFPLKIKEIGISQASAYKLTKKLNQQLDPFTIKIYNQKLTGSERSIRLKTFELLLFFFKGIESPFDKSILKSAHLLIHALVKLLDIPSSNSMKLKLEYFISVSLIRIKQGFVIEPADTLTFKKGTSCSSDRLYSILFSTFKQLFPALSEQETHMEVLYLIEFIVAESLFTDSSTLEGFTMSSKLTTQTSGFISHMRSACNSEEVFQLAEAKLTQETSASFLKHTLFNYHTDSFNNDLINQQFTELYVTESQLISEFILAQNNQNELPSESFSLFYDLLFLIVTHVPDNAFQLPLHICVDFSRSLTYSKHIKNKISAFDALKVIFDDEVTDDTNLYVSDFANYQINTPQIIWKDPPSINDWRLFGDTLIDIRKGM
ncbi:helix-turn-helix domain-containing protein [Vagococcus fessus]|nr:helix-turn-helix domain-containing protein [Vagococcus fessus]